MYFLFVENVGFHKNFRALPKVCRDETVQMPSCVDDLVTAGLWGREVLFFEDDDRAKVKTKIER